MDVKLNVEGRRELARQLRQVDRELVKGLKSANEAAAAVVAQRAMGEVPRRSGALAATIKPSATQSVGRVAVGSAKVPYAGVIHWGWPRHHIRANQFVTRAATQVMDKVRRAYVVGVDALIKKADLDG